MYHSKVISDSSSKNNLLLQKAELARILFLNITLSQLAHKVSVMQDNSVYM